MRKRLLIKLIWSKLRNLFYIFIYDLKLWIQKLLPWLCKVMTVYFLSLHFLALPTFFKSVKIPKPKPIALNRCHFLWEKSPKYPEKWADSKWCINIKLQAAPVASETTASSITDSDGLSQMAEKVVVEILRKSLNQDKLSLESTSSLLSVDSAISEVAEIMVADTLQRTVQTWLIVKICWGEPFLLSFYLF